MLAAWRERRFIATAFAIGLLVAAVISLLIPPQYESTTRILPPEKRGMNGLAAMLAASGAGDDKASSLVGGFVSDAIGIKSTGALQVGFLRSATVEDAIIDQFNLRKVYRIRYQKDARNALAERTDINEDRKSGIISITVTDRSPELATSIARAYTEQLGILTAQLDTSAAHKERVFLETRLQQVKQDLDSSSKALSDFSSKNVTLDVKEQGKAMVQGAATLEGELIATDSQLSGLKQIYTENNVRVRTLQARADQLKSKLAELRGSSDGPDTAGEFGVSIAKLPVLGLTYYDLFRRAKIQEAVFETLTKQFELAKIEEAKSVPTIKILDPAQVPEQKSSPKRTLITLCGALFAALMALCYVILSLHWRAMSPSHPMSLFGLEVRDGVARDLELVRKRAGPLLKAASKLRPRSKEPEHRDGEYPQS
jgi:uncharacterized protein involved in exopolysaccharide biosynthesis